jgi:hypothetical protein
MNHQILGVDSGRREKDRRVGLAEEKNAAGISKPAVRDHLVKRISADWDMICIIYSRSAVGWPSL